MRQGELLALKPESLYMYGIKVQHSINPTSDDTSLKIISAKRDISINQEIYELIAKILVKDTVYIFSFVGFVQLERLADLLDSLEIPKTTFHSLRDTRALFLFSQNIQYCICFSTCRS